MAEKSSPGTRQTDGKILVWFGEIDRKLAKLPMPILTVLPLNYFMGRTTAYPDCQAFCPVVQIVFPPTPSPPSEYCSPHLLGPTGETHPLAGEEMGGPNSDEGTDTTMIPFGAGHTAPLLKFCRREKSLPDSSLLRC
jgi:hypothetical protein